MLPAHLERIRDSNGGKQASMTISIVCREDATSMVFLSWGVGRVPYNAGNTAGFSNVAQEHFKVGCPS